MKKNIILAALMAILALCAVSCGKTNASSGSGSGSGTSSEKLTYNIILDLQSCSDMLEMVDITGSQFKIGSETIDLNKESLDKEFNGDLPCSGSLKIVAKPKAGFTPAKGKKYNANFDCSVSFAILQNGAISKIPGRFTVPYSNKKGINFEKAVEQGYSVESILSNICKELNIEYTFSLDEKGSKQDSYK